jgi:hypothetical protein
MEVVGGWKELAQDETEFSSKEWQELRASMADIAYPEEFVGFTCFSDI